MGESAENTSGASDQDILAAARYSYEAGDILRSISLYRQVIDAIEGNLGHTDLGLCQPLLRLGHLYERSGRNMHAEQFFRRAAHILAKNCAERTDPEAMKPYLME